MLFEIMLKEETTNILVEAENEKNALAIFKRQRLHKTGISKTDYSAQIKEGK